MFRRLFIATVIGILAALAVAGFHHAMLLLEWLFLNNDSGSLVNAAMNLSPWRRLLTPALGGLASRGVRRCANQEAASAANRIIAPSRPMALPLVTTSKDAKDLTRLVA